MLSKRTMNKIK